MIEVKHLSYRYPKSNTVSLQDIQLRLKPHQIFGLLGPNGAGKTTLLSLISGLLKCEPGHIFFEGEDLSLKGVRERTRLSLVPQEYAFYQPFTVLENLGFFARLQRKVVGNIEQQVQHAANVCGLNDHLEIRSAVLSGGLKRRLNLAIGLLNQPRLLLLDEPTVGIDPHSRHFILQTIRKLNETGTTVIYTSHYMEEVQSLCNDIAIIDHGKVLVHGSLAQLLASHKRSHLAIEFSHPVETEWLRQRGIDPQAMRQSGQLVEFDVQRPAEMLAILKGCADLSISSISYGAYNLENLFLDLTRRSLRD